MISFLLAVLVIAGVAGYLMTPEERTRILRRAVAAIPEVKRAMFGDPKSEPFPRALSARTPRAIATPVLLLANTAVFVLMVAAPGAMGDPQTLVAWGGTLGPRTTNGEWWRLVTSMFVHDGFLYLAVNVVCLAQLGFILERLVGPVAFVSAYMASGVCAGISSLAIYPLAVSGGASGGIFGIFGLLLAASIWGMRSSSNVAIPLAALKRLGPTAGVFILCNMAGGGLETLPEVVGLLVGLVYGVTLTRGIVDRKPAIRRVATVMTATLLIVAALAVPLRGIDDVRPELDRLVSDEDQTSRVYETAVARLRKGLMSAEALAGLVDSTIIPELQKAEARLRALDKVPFEHRPLVSAAGTYLRLRNDSWHLRAEGLRQMTMVKLQISTVTLRKAESTERAALEALQEIRVFTDPAPQSDQQQPR